MSQIVRRLLEKNTLQMLHNNKIKIGTFKLVKEHSGILINGTSDPQFKEAIFSSFKLGINLQNSCCKLKCNAIIEISNFAYCNKLNEAVLVGQ